MPASESTTTTPTIVLDTNVVLDWLVFHDPPVSPLAAALAARHLRWIATAPMLDELADVLRRPGLERWAGRLVSALDTARACALLQAAPKPDVPPGHPVCTDPDDQKFIDLALAAPARWLLTRDKALLKLARAAAARGVTVCTPAHWAAASAGARPGA